MISLKLILYITSIIYYGNCSNTTFSRSMFRNYIEPTSAILSIDTSYSDSCALRQAPGFVCMDCSVLARCIFRGNRWDTIALEACDAGQGLYCNPIEERCSSSPGPCHPDVGGGDNVFACTSPGVFPDPFNCQQYHMCFPSGPSLVAVNVLCGSNTAFNPVTNDCTLTTTNSICTQTSYKCSNVGEMGAWPMNPNIYYICMARAGSSRILFPQLFRCGIGEIFSNGDCVAGNNRVGLPPNRNPGEFACVHPGLFPDPSDCRSYFFCDRNLRAQRITCPQGTHFNRQMGECRRGSCI